MEGGCSGLSGREGVGNSVGSRFQFFSLNRRLRRPHPHLHPLDLAFSSRLCQSLLLEGKNERESCLCEEGGDLSFKKPTRVKST